VANSRKNLARFKLLNVHSSPYVRATNLATPLPRAGSGADRFYAPNMTKVFPVSAVLPMMTCCCDQPQAHVCLLLTALPTAVSPTSAS